MFEHVTILLSFVYALAVSHLLTSATELMWARDRVRVSWLQVVWMLNALLILFENWIGIWGLSALKQWDVAEVTIWFAAAINMFQNWWDRALIPAPLSWFSVDLTIAVLLITYAIAGFARAAWLQWSRLSRRPRKPCTGSSNTRSSAEASLPPARRPD
jgi:hypothetical protein